MFFFNFDQIFLISLRQFVRKKATLKYLNNHVWQVTLQVTLFALVLSAETETLRESSVSHVIELSLLSAAEHLLADHSSADVVADKLKIVFFRRILSLSDFNFLCSDYRKNSR